MDSSRYDLVDTGPALRSLRPAMVLVERPAPLLTLHQIRIHLRTAVDAQEVHPDDDYVQGLVAAATSELDGMTGWLGRALMPQTWKLYLDGFPNFALDLPLPSLISIESVDALDADGEYRSVDDTLYRVVPGSKYPFSAIRLKPGKSWPALPDWTDGVPDGAVAITFRCGFEEPQPAPPAEGQEAPARVLIPELEQIRAYARVRVGRWYEHREDVIAGTTFSEMPRAAAQLENLRAYHPDYLK